MEYKGIKLTLDMETKEFESAINRVKNSTNAYEKDIRRLKDILKLDPSNLEAYTALQDKLRAKIEETWEAQNFLKQTLNTGLQTGEIQKYSQEWINLTSVITQLNSKYDKTNQELNDLENGFQNVNSQTIQAKNNFQEAGEGASLLGTLIKSDLISSAIKTGLQEVVDLTKQLAKAYVDILKTGVEYNANMETYFVSIRAMLNGEEEAANNVINAMKEINSQSSFSVDALLSSAQQLIASDESAESAAKSIEDLAKALAYAGKSDDELKRMAQNLNQIKNAGKASAMDLKQFAYAGIPIYKLLAEYDSKRFGKGVDSKEDPATYEDIANALAKATEEGGKFADAFTIQADTYNGQLNKIKANWLNLVGVISQDATSSLTNDFLPAINETLVAMKEGFEENGIAGMSEALAKGIENLAPIILEKAPELLQDGIDIANGIIDGLLQEDENGDTFIEKAAKELVETLTTWSLDPNTWLKLFDVGWNLAKGIAKGFWQGLVNIFENNPTLAEAFSGSFSSLDFGGNRSGGWGNSGGFGALQSGGYGNITLNASFVANGNLNEAQAQRFAHLMAQQINEELGGQL